MDLNESILLIQFISWSNVFLHLNKILSDKYHFNDQDIIHAISFSCNIMVDHVDLNGGPCYLKWDFNIIIAADVSQNYTVSICLLFGIFL